MMWPGSVYKYQGVSPTFAQVCIGLIYGIIQIRDILNLGRIY